MKYLIFLALVALALAAPPKKPEKLPEGPKPANPPPNGTIYPFDHPNVTGQPPHVNSSSPPHPKDLENSDEHTFDHHNVAGFGNSSKPTHSEELDDNDHPSHPKPAGGPSSPPCKPPAKPESHDKPAQGPKPTPKQHVSGAETHPTGAPPGDRTPESGAISATLPAIVGGGKPGGLEGQRG
ncbi:uncharacterized protein LOC143768389 [Ranitomeya variabilis]|uniref:uncharacterized protein LOC143768389 n=1 Tax=Ranitomeya variabilis TaxID=490064 RepID=UPI004055D1D9